MRVWRIGSNWGGIDIFPVFKDHNIAFAGLEVENSIKQVKEGELIAITNGQQIIAIAKAKGLGNLRTYNPNYVSLYDDVSCIQLSCLYTKDDYKGIDFGIYNGQGKKFHEAHNDYTKNIKNLYNRLNYINMQNNIIDLLKYKKQIILQGPPGTGKTRLAKEIAKELTKVSTLESPQQKINDFFKNFDASIPENASRRNEAYQLLSDFQTRFPKEKIKELSLVEHCIGRGTHDSFCWWLERGLKPLGYYFPGSARSYLIYWKKDINDYSKHTNLVKNIQDNEEALKKVTSLISDFVETKDFMKANKYFGDGFLLKLLHSYYPNEYTPINSVNCMNNVLKLLGVDYSKLNSLEKNLKIQEIFEQKKAEFNTDITNNEFMRFLFANFDLFGKISVQPNQVITEGEYKVIQFHPAYSYEDFIRGITTVANDNKIEYKVENRILAEYADKALKSPLAKFILVIDEINRANLPSVLGEMIYALEYRFDENNPEDTSVESMYGLPIDSDSDDESESKILKLPKNLFIIGTMNTADRSVGHIDYAIRRRFAFVDIPPSETVIDEVVVDATVKTKAKDLFKKVAALFIEGNIAADFKASDVKLGHSYFLGQTEKELELKLKYEIKPLLKEYVKDGILQPTLSNGNSGQKTEEYIDQLSL